MVPRRPSTDSTNHCSSLVHLKVATGYMSKGFFFDAVDGICHGFSIKLQVGVVLYNQGTSFAIEDWNPAKHMTCKGTLYNCFSMMSAINCISAPVEVGEMPVEVGDFLKHWSDDGLCDQCYSFFLGGDAEGLGSTCSRVFFSRWNRSFEICWKQSSGKSKDKQNSQKVMKMNIRGHARFTVQTTMNILMTRFRCFLPEKSSPDQANSWKQGRFSDEVSPRLEV